MSDPIAEVRALLDELPTDVVVGLLVLLAGDLQADGRLMYEDCEAVIALFEETFVAQPPAKV